MGLDRLAQAGLDQLAEHLAPHLLAEGPLEHGPWHATGAEAAQPRLAPDRREGALQLRLHVRRGDLHLEALADRGQVLERDVRRVHHVSPRVATPRYARGGIRTPTVAREILNLVRLPIPPLSLLEGTHP